VNETKGRIDDMYYLLIRWRERFEIYFGGIY